MLSEAFVLTVMLLPCVVVADFVEAEKSSLSKAFGEIVTKFGFSKMLQGAEEMALSFENVSNQNLRIMSSLVQHRISTTNDAKIIDNPELSTMVQETGRGCQDIEMTLVESPQSSLQLHS